jgi:hypothetical protein
MVVMESGVKYHTHSVAKGCFYVDRLFFKKEIEDFLSNYCDNASILCESVP